MLRLEVVTRTQKVLEEDVEEVRLPGVLGELGILTADRIGSIDQDPDLAEAARDALDALGMMPAFNVGQVVLDTNGNTVTILAVSYDTCRGYVYRVDECHGEIDELELTTL